MTDEKLEIFDISSDEVAEGGVADMQAGEADEPAQPGADEAPQPEAEDTGETEEVAPPVASERKPADVPVTALLDEREKRQALEREVAQLRQNLQAREQYERAQQQNAKKPDFYEDPDKAFAHYQQQQAFVAWDRELDRSKYRMIKEYGQEAVIAAESAYLQAMQADPSLNLALQRHPEPYDHVVQWHKRQEFLNEVQDPDAWRKAEREKIRAEMQAELSQSSPVKAPPSSLASAPATGGREPVTLSEPAALRGFFTGG